MVLFRAPLLKTTTRTVAPLCNGLSSRGESATDRRQRRNQMDGQNVTSNGSHNDDNNDSNYKWCPSNIIGDVSAHFTTAWDKGRHACLVLNTPIRLPAQVAQSLWSNAQIRCMVDGGANRWRHFLSTHCQQKVGMETLPPPDLITGDFDSVTAETRAFFNDEKTRWVHTPDQDATDFTKAVGVLRPLLAAKQLNDIIVFHDTCGRLDQIMANINTLFKVQSAVLNVYLISGNSLTWLLRPGRHSISIPHDLVAQQRWCALIPVGEPARCVTTTGLKWNLTNSEMAFGSLVSTSNTYATENVQIVTGSCLLWSMGVFSFKDEQ